jgi:hypothetical protein
MTPINQSSGQSSHELHIHLQSEKPSLLSSSVSSSDDTANSLHKVLENMIASDKQHYSPLGLCNVLNSDWSFCVLVYHRHCALCYTISLGLARGAWGINWRMAKFWNCVCRHTSLAFYENSLWNSNGFRVPGHLIVWKWNIIGSPFPIEIMHLFSEWHSIVWADRIAAEYQILLVGFKVQTMVLVGWV